MGVDNDENLFICWRACCSQEASEEQEESYEFTDTQGVARKRLAEAAAKPSKEILIEVGPSGGTAVITRLVRWDYGRFFFKSRRGALQHILRESKLQY